MTDNSPRYPTTPSLTIEELIRDHYRVAYQYSYRLTGSTYDAEDLVQQSFLTAHRKLHQLRDPKAAKGWLFQILRTTFFQSCRKKKPVCEADSALELGSILHDMHSTEPHFDNELLQQRLNTLPDKYRIALLMYYFEDLSYEEISSQLDIPLGTVMSRLARAKALLRTRYQALGAPSK